MKPINNDPFANAELTTILVVSDMKKSVAFYADLLGAQLFRSYGGDSTVLKFLNSWLLLVTGGDPTEDKPDVFFKPPVNRNTVSHAFTIRVENCDKSYKILKERGVDFITPPLQRGAETRCFFHDPDGHLFEISEYRQ